MKEVQRVRRFTMVAAGNAVVDLGVFNLLVLINPSRSPEVLVLYNTISVVAALLNSYLWNSRWTFGDRSASDAASRRRQRTLFLGQAAVNLAVNNVTIYAVSFLLQPFAGLSAAAVSNIAKVFAMLAASATSYVLMRRLVFRR